jgi:hypothetical protein
MSDQEIQPVRVRTPGGAVLSVPADRVDAARAIADEAIGSAARDPIAGLLVALPDAIGYPSRGSFRAVFRWTVNPMPLPDAGTWIAADDAVVPGWLRVFNGDVLIAQDPRSGAYLAGVGIKRHDQYGHELAVGTVPAAAGAGWPGGWWRRPPAGCSMEGAIPTYLHSFSNVASAKVAGAAGLRDEGWTAFGVSEEP